MEQCLGGSKSIQRVDTHNLKNSMIYIRVLTEISSRLEACSAKTEKDIYQETLSAKCSEKPRIRTFNRDRGIVLFTKFITVDSG